MSDELLYVPEIVPVFPLPEVVLFPRTILPLHVFEPRYRELISDALAGERIIAVALLRAGYQPLYYTRRAPIHTTMGIGRILGSERVADGNYNLLLGGVARARIIKEVSTRAYRAARIELLQTFCSHDAARAGALRDELCQAIRGNRALATDLRSHWLRLAKMELGLDELTDLIAAGMPVEAELRQCLLEEPDAAARATMLVEQVRTLAAIARTELRALRPDRCSLN